MVSRFPFRLCLILIVTFAAVIASLGTASPEQARAERRCHVDVKRLSLQSKQAFSGHNMLKRYAASVDYPVGTTYDQSAKIVLGVYSRNVYPTLLRSKIGTRTKTGVLAKQQTPHAFSAINGDFFLTPKIRGRTLEVARGPMVRNGRIIRADRDRQRVVGVDKKFRPFAGVFGIKGGVRRGSHKAVDIVGVNWHRVQRHGATIYTHDWKASQATPRPAGRVEWVLNGNDRIVQLRSLDRNANKRGNPVADGRRVIAFSRSDASAARRAKVGNRVHVNLRQSTNNGRTLQTGIGRGLPLIKRGVAAPLGCAAYESKAARPRTIVGWNKAGAWRTFIVPGKYFSGPGLRQGGFGLAMSAAIAKKLGLWQAYELDGGGSTTMYTQNTSGKWTRRDLYGFDTSTGAYEREMPNGLAFKHR